MLKIICEFEAIVLNAKFDPDPILEVFSPTFKSLYDLYVGLLGPVLLVVLAGLGYKYMHDTKKEERSFLGFAREIALPLGIGIVIASLPIVIKAFGFRLW